VCVFCERIAQRAFTLGNDLAVALDDALPVSPGHTLIVPVRHEANWFLLTDEEQGAVWRLVAEAKQAIDRDRRPDGYNIGINAGVAAGQTIEHAHLHLIPRYAGDVDDPRGGVRWVLPQRAAYWKR
jgi:diadenosine tetraphosphate (Ap4A) HIT family hydrolase